VIRDFLNPDFVLIGESDPRSGAILESIYQQVCENTPHVSRMNFIDAELTKLSVNTFVTTKISFANMLARICEQLPGANVDVVTAALGQDSRIGAKYLKGAISYGGPCFPRDNHALVALAREIGAPADLAEVTDRFNRSQVNWLANLAQRYAAGTSSVGILGLTYKPHTDVAEEAPGVLLAKELARRGVSLVLYDPACDPNWMKALDSRVRVAQTPEECVKQSEVVVLTTPWRECCAVPTEQWARHSPPRTVIDCWRALPHLEHADGMRYLALGTGSLLAASRASACAEISHESKETPILTLFALPKAFKGHFGLIQRNAISQWARLRPRPEIILFGNEEGTAEIAQEFGLRHVPDVACNEYGTPLLSDLFEKAQTLASCNALCYVNADIILMGDFMKAVQQVASWRERFLMVGRRTDVDLDAPAIYESSDQEDRLRALVMQRGRLSFFSAIDYFVFPRGLFPTVPEFAIGRFFWDNWIIWRARALKVAVVDASAVVLAVHQNHDYSHHRRGQRIWGEETSQNRKLAGRGVFNIDDATHIFTGDGIKPRPYLSFIPKAVRACWWQFLRITWPIRGPLGLRREKIARVLGRIGLPSN
jgi:UDP-glucose/GDP-mannose dehydrogenase family protein